jgi:hypothetical protein
MAKSRKTTFRQTDQEKGEIISLRDKKSFMISQTEMNQTKSATLAILQLITPVQKAFMLQRL